MSPKPLHAWSKWVIESFGPWSPACAYIDNMILKHGGNHIPEMPDDEMAVMLVKMALEDMQDDYLRDMIIAANTELYPGDPINLDGTWN